MNDRINILIACDKNYAPYYGVLLASLFKHNPDSYFHIHWITDLFVPQSEKNRFYRFIKENNSQLSIYEIDNDKLKNFPQSTHLNYAAYYNLNAANILPESVHKIIYMDGDMVVNGDIRPIWDIDLKDYACAMVEDCSTYDKDIYQRLEYSSQYGFYNNGVTVYNLDYLRKMNFSEKALQFIADNPEKALWMDQDAINVLLAEKTLRLPLTCNFQTLFLLEYHWMHYSEDFRKQIFVASCEPIVIHYAGRVKPWQWRYYGLPYKKEWDEAYQSSPWHCARQYKPLSKYVKHLIKRLIKGDTYIEKCQREYIAEAHNLC